MICVQGVYVDGLERRVADFGRKHDHYGGGLDRDSLIAGLRRADERLDGLLERLRSTDQEAFTIEFYGQQKLGSYLNVLLHHEALHHGQWSFYSTPGEFATPQSWQLNWGL